MLYAHGKQLRSCWDGQLLITLFLGKSLGGSLPVFSAHSFASNLQLALLESAEEEDYFSSKECAGCEDRSRDRYLQSGHTTDRNIKPSFPLLVLVSVSVLFYVSR